MDTMRKTGDYFFLHSYYRVMRFFMLVMGQWPYDDSITKNFIRVAISVLFGYLFQAQILLLVGYRHDFTLFIQAFPPALICGLCGLRYYACWMSINKIKGLLEHLKEDWSIITDQKELTILGEYTNLGRVLGLYYMICTYAGIFAVLCLQLLPVILDLAMPLDEPRPRKPLVEIQIFDGQEEHYCIFLLVSILSITVLFSISGATDLIYLSYLLHGCGILSVLAYRFEHMFDDNEGVGIDVESKSEILYFSRKVIEGVQLHCRIFKYMRMITSCYDVSYLLQLLLIVILLSGLLVHLCYALTIMHNVGESLTCIVHVSGLLYIIFLNILPAQMLLNKSADLFHRVYFSRWQGIPEQLQKSLLIIMQNSIKPRGLCMYGLVTASLQVFATIVQTSVSYFSVLYTISQ